MDTRQMTAMAEATRLTRQGRLVEATALIQQTLASTAVTRRTTDAPSAGEENDSTRDRHPNVPAPLPAHRGKPPRRVIPGWTRHSRAFLSPGVSGIRYASVFKYYGNAVEDGLDPIRFFGVTAAAIALAAIGAWLFDRRDLADRRWVEGHVQSGSKADLQDVSDQVGADAAAKRFGVLVGAHDVDHSGEDLPAVEPNPVLGADSGGHRVSFQRCGSAYARWASASLS